ncbi:hypothetical protein [Streptomyces longwoodensis]|uniref:hypothetical protein n=1 Tax=Streptomyces longwoodensis TaxID=68231 RepID=UPI0036E5F304
MDGEVTVALIGGVGALVGALLGGAATVWTAKEQGRMAVQTALHTARSTYLGPLDTARRSAQRDVFAAFLTVSQEWARSAEPATEAARRWDADVGRLLDECITEGRAYTGLSAELRQHWSTSIARLGTTQRLTEAVQHVLLEAAATDVARAAQNVEQHAIRLAGLLHGAGETQLLDPDRVSPGDPSNHVPPSPERSPNQLRALKEAIDAFTWTAATHLNMRDADNAPDISHSA